MGEEPYSYTLSFQNTITSPWIDGQKLVPGNRWQNTRKLYKPLQRSAARDKACFGDISPKQCGFYSVCVLWRQETSTADRQCFGTTKFMLRRQSQSCATWTVSARFWSFVIFYTYFTRNVFWQLVRGKWLTISHILHGDRRVPVSGPKVRINPQKISRFPGKRKSAFRYTNGMMYFFHNSTFEVN